MRLIQRRFFTLLCLLFALFWQNASFAQDGAISPSNSVRVAQFDADDSYDPFADYSEFDGASEEEEDINFFRNGRFLSIGLIAGYRGFTESLGQLVSGSMDYGIFLSYFFDLRFALQFSFLSSDHQFGFNDAGAGGTHYSGDMAIQNFGFDLKYYVNTQNVTKGLAKFNPFILVGFSYIFRTENVSTTSAFGKDSAPAFDLGAGIEWPLMRNKMFWGLQAMYQQVSFSDANTPLRTAADGANNNAGITPHGSTYTLMGTLGINF